MYVYTFELVLLRMYVRMYVYAHTLIREHRGLTNLQFILYVHTYVVLSDVSGGEALLLYAVQLTMSCHNMSQYITSL